MAREKFDVVVHEHAVYIYRGDDLIVSAEVTRPSPSRPELKTPTWLGYLGDDRFKNGKYFILGPVHRVKIPCLVAQLMYNILKGNMEWTQYVKRPRCTRKTIKGL